MNERALEELLREAGATEKEIEFFKRSTEFPRQLVGMIRRVMRIIERLGFTAPPLKESSGAGKRRGTPTKDDLIAAMIRVQKSGAQITQTAVALDLGYGGKGNAISGVFKHHPELKQVFDETKRTLNG